MVYKLFLVSGYPTLASSRGFKCPRPFPFKSRAPARSRSLQSLHNRSFSVLRQIKHSHYNSSMRRRNPFTVPLFARLFVSNQTQESADFRVFFGIVRGWCWS